MKPQELVITPNFREGRFNVPLILLLFHEDSNCLVLNLRLSDTIYSILCILLMGFTKLRLHRPKVTP